MSLYYEDGIQKRVSLFDPALRRTLRERGLYCLRMFIIYSAMYWTGTCLLYGMVYKRSLMTHHAAVEVIDLDHGDVGRSITQSLLLNNLHQRLNAPTYRLRTDIHSIGEARTWIRRHGWGGVVINEGTSQRLQNPDSSYNPKLAITIINNTGRQAIITASHVQPQVNDAVASAIRNFTLAHLSQLAHQSPSPSVQILPVLAVRPIASSTVDVGPYGISMAPVFNIYPFQLGTFLTIMALLQLKMTTHVFFCRVKHWQLWIAAATMTTLLALLAGLYGALAVSAFLGPHHSHVALPYSVGRFFSMWFSITAGVLPMAAWLFNWYLVLTPEFFGPITFISIVSNTGSMMAPFGLAPHFFRYNRIQPFYNGAMLFRYILSGAYPKVGINVSILLGESALMLAIMYITTWFRQTTLLLGITDVPGWHRSSIFFHGNIPYYKTAAPEEPEPLVISKREFVVSEHGGDSLSLREGNLGI